MFIQPLLHKRRIRIILDFVKNPCVLQIPEKTKIRNKFFTYCIQGDSLTNLITRNRSLCILIDSVIGYLSFPFMYNIQGKRGILFVRFRYVKLFIKIFYIIYKLRHDSSIRLVSMLSHTQHVKVTPGMVGVHPFLANRFTQFRD